MIARFHYDNEILARMLRDQLREDEREVAEHVETCDQCQTRLETITQDGLTWEEAGELLRDDSFDEPIHSLGDGLGALAGRTFLQPTNHPNSLGRFGRYEIMEFLGRGGMGIVMRGFDPALNRHSAIKVLAPELASSAAARQRFSREAKSAAAVVHPHVVPIQTVDEQDGLPYLVMPVVEGQSLQQRVDTNGPLEIVEVVRIAAQIAEGLAAAHDRGLVHRDIKPANILLENGVERVQITDFGLARAADDASMTRSGVIAGTPQYMSPEQAHGDEIDHRSDLFSLGSVMYFMLTGRSPFRAETTMGVLNRIGNDHPRRLRSINPDIPPWLAAVVHRLLEKNPTKRYASAEMLATELQARLVELQDGTEAIAGGRKSSAPSCPPSRRWALLAGGGAMCALLAGLFLIETDQGTIRIETNDNVTVPIRIRQGDEIVDRLTVTSDGASARVRAGTYTIEIEGNNQSLEVKNNKAVVKANDVWIARIELIPAGSESRFEESEAGQSAKDPSIVRNLALEDASHGRYEQALDKMLWYWDNAARIQPALSAVRRSFLLSDWLQLGEAYPPALEKMRSVRDELQQRIESADQVRVPSEAFADFAAINRTLRDEARTKEVYEKIKARDPEDARRLRFYVNDQDHAGATQSKTDELAAKPSLVTAVAQYNVESAPLRARFFDVDIPDITPPQMIDAFAHAAVTYRRLGKASVADRLQRVVDTKNLADLRIFLTGTITGDEANPIARQIVPATMIPGPNVVVPLRKLELMYSRDGYSSKIYGDIHPPLDGRWRLAGVEKNGSNLGDEQLASWAAEHPLWRVLVIDAATVLMDGDRPQSLYELELNYDSNPLPKFSLSQQGKPKFEGVFMGNGFIDDTTLTLAVALDGGEPPTTFRTEDSKTIKLTYKRAAADAAAADRASTASPEFPPVKISVDSEDGSPLAGALVRMSLLDKARRDALLEVSDTSAQDGVAVNRVLPFGKYYLRVQTADGWYTSIKDANVEFDKGLELTFVAPSPDKQAQLLIESSASEIDPSKIASLPFGVFQLHSRTTPSWTQSATPEPGSEAGDYDSFPTPGDGIEQVALSINVDVRREIPQPSGESARWSWVPDNSERARRFLLFNDQFYPIADSKGLHAVPVKGSEYFVLADSRAKVGGAEMTLAEPVASPLSLEIPAGEVTVYVDGPYGRPTDEVLQSLRLTENLAPHESIWLDSNLKLKSAWIDRLLVTDGWTYRRSGDGTIVGHLIRREQTIKPDETAEISIHQGAKQP